MELPHRAFVGVARVSALDARRVGGHAFDFLRHAGGVFAQGDRVVVAFAHLGAVQARQAAGGGEQNLRLDQHGAAGALEVARQALAVIGIEFGCLGNVGQGTFHGLGVARFLVLFARLFKPLDAVARQLGQAGGDALLCMALASVQMVEAPRRLAGELHVAGLVFAHGHVIGLVDQDVGRLQQWVAQKTVGAQVFVFELFLLVFVGGHALQPTDGGAHGQQGEQLGVLGQAAL